MNKFKIIIIAISLFFTSLLTVEFIQFMETQRDVLGILNNKQVFQIEEPKREIDLSKIEKPKVGIKIPDDILRQMQDKEKEKQLKIKQEKAEQERQKKLEEEKIFLAKKEAEKKKEEQKVTSRGTTIVRKEETTKTDNSDWIKFTATFYDNCIKCCGKTTGRTAMGTIATPGRTVAMPSSYKFGTKIQIKGMGTYVVEDRGGAIQGNRIDIFVSSHAEALRMGRKTVYLKVVQ